MDEDKVVEDLILNGSLEVSGVDIDTGELLYSFTEVLKELDPELHNKLNNFFYQEILALWEKGFINISFLEEDPIVTVADKAYDTNSISKLSKDSQESLKQIKRITNES